MSPHLPVAGDWLGRQPFRRVFDRTVLLVALTGLWPLTRNVGIRSWAELGFACLAAWWRQILLGAALGVASFALAAALAGRPPDLNRSTTEIVAALLRYALTGVVVALIEETFFRGGLQGALQRVFRLPVAIALTSIVYSTVHFLKPSGVNIGADAVTWNSGLVYLGQVLAHSLDRPGVAVAFLSLFLVGCILGFVFAKSGALYFPIGLHAGWVLANEFTRWLGMGKLIEQWVTWPVLAAVFVGLWWNYRAKPEAQRT